MTDSTDDTNSAAADECVPCGGKGWISTWTEKDNGMFGWLPVTCGTCKKGAGEAS